MATKGMCVHRCTCLCMYWCSNPHTYPDTYACEILQCHSNTPPRIVLPTDSVARIRKEHVTPNVGDSIDTDSDIKRADSYESSRPPEQHRAGINASQIRANSEVDIQMRLETPASASALHRNNPFCSHAGHLSRRSILVALEPHQSGMMRF